MLVNLQQTGVGISASSYNVLCDTIVRVRDKALQSVRSASPIFMRCARHDCARAIKRFKAFVALLQLSCGARDTIVRAR